MRARPTSSSARATTWTEQQKLLATDGAASDWFGYSVSASGDTVFAGAYLADAAGGVDAGAAYGFARSGPTWTQQQKLLATDADGGRRIRLRGLGLRRHGGGRGAA